MRRVLLWVMAIWLVSGILGTSAFGASTGTVRAQSGIAHSLSASYPADLAATLVDSYGYVASSTTYAWEEFDARHEVVEFYPNSDDAYTGLLSITFNFPFYEKTYTQARISTNGYLTLDTSSTEQLIRNLALPSDQKPNSLIAPFWDDLTKGGGALYYGYGTLGGQNYFGVQWENFSRFNETSTLTFQVLLLANGNILVQYKEMTGTLTGASVGIEDGDGVDGISYLFNGTGPTVAAGTAILFTFPQPGRRAKLTPLYSGGFIVAGKAQFDLTLTNTGNVTPLDSQDSYTFESVVDSLKPGWQVAFQLNGLPVVNSGLLSQLSSRVYQVVVVPPAGAEVGDHALIRLKATSTSDPTRSATVSVQVAVPAKFMHAYADSQGMHLGLYWKENVVTDRIATFDQNVALAPAGGKYVMVWDFTYGLSNLSYVTIDELGTADSYVSLLEIEIDTFDWFPSLASGLGDDHRVAVVWSQYVQEPDLDRIYNLWLAVLDPALDQPVVVAPGPVTFNTIADTSVGGFEIQDASAFWVDEDKLWLVWKEKRFESTDIRAGFFSLAAGDFVGDPFLLAQGDPDGYYADLTLVGIADGTVLAFFTRVNDVMKTHQIYWSALAAGGSVAVLPQELLLLQGGTGDTGMDAAILAGKVMLTWVTPDRGAVAYNLLSVSGSGSTMSLALGETRSLLLQNLNLVEHVSLFADQSSNGILTWKNVDDTQMYYALVDSGGNLRTPAVMFYHDPSAGIMVSKNGQSSTIYVGAFHTAMPILNR